MSTSQFFAILAIGIVLFLLMVFSSKEKTRALKNVTYGWFRKRKTLSRLKNIIRCSYGEKKELAAKTLIKFCERKVFNRSSIIFILRECTHQSAIDGTIIYSAKAFYKLFKNPEPGLVEKIVNEFGSMTKEQLLEIEWILNYGQLKPK